MAWLHYIGSCSWVNILLYFSDAFSWQVFITYMYIHIHSITYVKSEIMTIPYYNHVVSHVTKTMGWSRCSYLKFSKKCKCLEFLIWHLGGVTSPRIYGNDRSGTTLLLRFRNSKTENHSPWTSSVLPIKIHLIKVFLILILKNFFD